MTPAIKRRVLHALKSGASGITSIASSAVLWMTLCGLAAGICVVTGVSMIAGPAWAFIAAGVALGLAASLIGRGMHG